MTRPVAMWFGGEPSLPRLNTMTVIDGRLDSFACSRQLTVSGMPKNRPANKNGTQQDASDYHPVLVSRKPLEQALREACAPEAGFKADANSMINALKGVVDAELIQELHKLRMSRNDISHDVGKSRLSQVGMTELAYTTNCARLAKMLHALPSQNRQRANTNLMAGERPEFKAWRCLNAKLQELTSKQSTFECIQHLSNRIPQSLTTRLFGLRQAWAEIRKGNGDILGFTADVYQALHLLENPQAAQVKEPKVAVAQTKKVPWSGAGVLAREVEQSWKSFEAWFAKNVGPPERLTASIARIKSFPHFRRKHALRPLLLEIRKLKIHLREAVECKESEARRFLQLIRAAKGFNTSNYSPRPRRNSNKVIPKAKLKQSPSAFKAERVSSKIRRPRTPSSTKQGGNRFVDSIVSAVKSVFGRHS